MGNLRIRRRPFTKQKDASTVVGRVKPNGGCCKKHPKHQQSPGVCSLCLKEKLAKLPAAFSHRRRVTTSLCSSYTSSSSVSSLSSYYDSLCSTSSCPSPVHCGSSSGPIFPVLFKHGIMRRKSMSTVATQARKRDHHDEDYEGGVRGFWFNFLHPKRKIGKDERDTNNKMHRSMFYKSKGLHNQLKP
ncbi:uncharacterized protein LOC130940764 [Arachis stenosperma]|uniref:uncharacterized protein LOC130940764 n=1 Tax=Arachis stenosperma TaxID=217475 RepID=UPI0025ABAA78|nr:uncharacterized protein LOC130940764 [Arachis stenosperma]